MRIIDNILNETLQVGLTAALLTACAVNALLLWTWL
jgi:hypothetical protein